MRLILSQKQSSFYSNSAKNFFFSVLGAMPGRWRPTNQYSRPVPHMRIFFSQKQVGILSQDFPESEQIFILSHMA
jgi:hypothetical protein